VLGLDQHILELQSMETTTIQAPTGAVSVETFQYMANVLTADTVTFISSVESVIESVNAFPIAFREYLDARFKLQIEQEFNLLHFAEHLEISGAEYEATATRIWNKTHGRIKSLQELEKKASAVAEVAQ
jgi:hypothetical protein